MKLALRIAALNGCLAMATGCADKPPNTFIFTADLPPDFAYRAAVYYVPAPGETCTVETRYNKAPVFNRAWREAYKPDSEIVIRRTRMGCPLVINRIELQIHSAYGKDWSDISHDSATVLIHDALEEHYKGVFSEAGDRKSVV